MPQQLSATLSEDGLHMARKQVNQHPVIAQGVRDQTDLYTPGTEHQSLLLSQPVKARPVADARIVS
jgi:hypothetical protein